MGALERCPLGRDLPGAWRFVACSMAYWQCCESAVLMLHYLISHVVYKDAQCSQSNCRHHAVFTSL